MNREGRFAIHKYQSGRACQVIVQVVVSQALEELVGKVVVPCDNVKVALQVRW